MKGLTNTGKGIKRTDIESNPSEAKSTMRPTKPSRGKRIHSPKSAEAPFLLARLLPATLSNLHLGGGLNIELRGLKPHSTHLPMYPEELIGMTITTSECSLVSP